MQGSLISDKINMENSKFLQLNSIDYKKLGIGALIAVGGALLTYWQDTFLTLDFGVYQGLAVAINSIIINFVRKLLSGTNA